MISIISLVLAITSTVSGLVPHSHNVARHAIHARTKPAPNDQYSNYLESYTTYHTRYCSLKCQDRHNTSFFDKCCHPLLATETVEKNRPEECQVHETKLCDDDNTGTPYDDQYNKEKEKPKPKPAPPAEHKVDVEPPKPKGNHDDKPKKADVGGGGDNNGGDLIKGGFATFFLQNGVPGACGKVHSDGDFIAAMNVARYGNTGVHSPLCGKMVKIINPANQKVVNVEVVDACPGCKNSNSIDLSTGAFNQIAKPEEGMVPIHWSFV